MSTYQDVITSAKALAAWALTESSGTTFAPYISGSNLVGSGTFSYRVTGPFTGAFGLHLNVGAKVTLTFLAVVNPPVTVEGWFRLPTNPPTSLTQLWSTGTSASNGDGMYVATNGHIHNLRGGRADTDTLLVWPDTNWHLVQYAANANGALSSIALDGVVRWRAQPAQPNAPSPNILTYGGDQAAGAATALELAMPAFYAYELDPGQLAASFTAATNPDGAIGATITGGGIALASNALDLSAILAAVRHTYVNAP